MAPVAMGQGLVIEHKELSCVVADKFPRLTACIAPRSRVAQARVYFRAESTLNWYYIQLTSDTPCHRGVLPKPKKTLHQFSYYIAVTDTVFNDTRTLEYTAEVAPDEASCRKGPAAPFLSSASVAVSSAGGATVIPEGFLASGLAGAGLSSGLLLGVVGGGAAVAGGIAAIGGGGTRSGQSPGPGPSAVGALPPTPTTTTPPGTPPTTVPITLPGPPPTTLRGAPTPATTLPGPTTTTLPPLAPTTTTVPSCSGQTTPPNVTITSPSGSGPLPGLSAQIEASASGASGIAQVQFFYHDTGGGAPVLIGTIGSPPYRLTWVFPSCSVVPNGSLLKLYARAIDRCGNTGTSRKLDVTLTGRSCFLSLAHPPPVLGWTNDLSVPGGRGQIVLNGTEAFYPGPGASLIAAQGQPDHNRVEAVLVEGQGKSGTWRFHFGGNGVMAGSLQVVAGEVELVTPDTIVFRLAGRPGERVVFSFRVLPHE
jgi:hypothetical protein